MSSIFGYAGKVVGSLYSGISEINPSTLSGAIDVVVVEGPSGELNCSPFHVRFGKFKLLSPREKGVEVSVNGELTSIKMKMGEAGEAFFVVETENPVPTEFATSPPLYPMPELPSQSAELMEPFNLNSTNVDESQLNGKASINALYLEQNISSNTPIPESLMMQMNSLEALDLDTRLIQSSTSPTGQTSMHNIFTSEERLPYRNLRMSSKHSFDDSANQSPLFYSARMSFLPGSPSTEEAPFSFPISLDERVDRYLNDLNDTRASVSSSSRVPKFQHVPEVFDTEAPAQSSAPTLSPMKSIVDLVIESDTSLPPHGMPSNGLSSSVGSNRTIKLGNIAPIDTRGKSPPPPFSASPLPSVVEFPSKSSSFEIGISRCGVKSIRNQSLIEAQARFEGKRLSFEAFMKKPSLEDPDLIIRINSEFYIWEKCGPILVSCLIFGRSLTEVIPFLAGLSIPVIVQPHTVPSEMTSQQQQQHQVSKKYSISENLKNWWTGGTNPNSGTSTPSVIAKDGARSVSPALSNSSKHLHLPRNMAESSREKRPQHYAKSLRLTSEQLASLKLKRGMNNVVFSVTSSLQGRGTCSARIFLWKHDDKVVISDIDGTITKSDVLGHVFNMVGRDWTQEGVAKLFSRIHRNGYKFLYLTARAIGQASSTRDYLSKVEQASVKLPEGPVFLSPDRLFKSFHREVIARRPEEFKISCLRDVQRLFGGNAKCFWAGFGNRITDAFSYRSVDVPSSRIFLVDPRGELKLELISNFSSSYKQLTDLVDQIFPPVQVSLAGGPIAEPDFNDFNYWRSPIVMDPDLEGLGKSEDEGSFDENQDEDEVDDVEEGIEYDEGDIEGDDVSEEGGLMSDVITEETEDNLPKDPPQNPPPQDSKIHSPNPLTSSTPAISLG